MAAEEDTFDIDIYGDGGGGGGDQQETDEYKQEDHEIILDTPGVTNNSAQSEGQSNGEWRETSNFDGNGDLVNGRASQGVKRKEFDDRPSDPDATTALIISDLFWWTTDDDVRGWANQADAEDELKDVIFSEHKVNGKSKGYALFPRWLDHTDGDYADKYTWNLLRQKPQRQ